MQTSLEGQAGARAVPASACDTSRDRTDPRRVASQEQLPLTSPLAHESPAYLPAVPMSSTSHQTESSGRTIRGQGWRCEVVRACVFPAEFCSEPPSPRSFHTGPGDAAFLTGSPVRPRLPRAQWRGRLSIAGGGASEGVMGRCQVRQHFASGGVLKTTGKKDAAFPVGLADGALRAISRQY